jgi:hypothetical protein
MALATMGTAWSSFQSAAWSRQAGVMVSKANKLERNAGVMELQGNQEMMMHIALFMQILAARKAGNEKLAEFYSTRLPPEAKRGYEAWLAQRPFENPEAAPHPFVTNLYEVRFSRDASAAREEAVVSGQNAGKAGDISGQYLANTVLCASVLFFTGVAGKFEVAWVRRALFALAGATLLYVGFRLALLLPVAS